MTLAMIIVLFILHFVGDFLFQTDWMATNKSKNWWALLLHASVYSLCFLPFGLTFMTLTLGTHFWTDAITSRITSRLWFFERAWPNVNEWVYVEGKRHYFFVMIGFDQLIHAITLLLTLRLLTQ